MGTTSLAHNWTFAIALCQSDSSKFMAEVNILPRINCRLFCVANSRFNQRRNSPVAFLQEFNIVDYNFISAVYEKEWQFLTEAAKCYIFLLTPTYQTILYETEACSQLFFFSIAALQQWASKTHNCQELGRFRRSGLIHLGYGDE